MKKGNPTNWTFSDLGAKYVEEEYGDADGEEFFSGEMAQPLSLRRARMSGTAISGDGDDGAPERGRLLTRKRSVSYDSFMIKKLERRGEAAKANEEQLGGLRQRTQAYFAHWLGGGQFEEDEDYERSVDEAAQKEAQDLYNEEEELDRRLQHEAGHSLGTKSIGTLSSFVFVFNQISGPGSLAIPIVLQQSGLLPTLLIMLGFVFISSFSSTFLIECMGKIRGNEDFHRRVEYSTLVRHYFGARAHFVFQIFLNLSLQALNISSIVITCQSLDTLFTYVYGTCALEMYPHFRFVCITHMRDVDALLYAGGGVKIMITLGYVVTALLSIPLGFINLDDNMKVQWISFVFLLIFFVEFLWDFIFNHSPLHFEKVALMKSDFSQLSSVFIMSFAFPMLVPSWVNEKKPHVSVQRTIWLSAAATFAGYVVFGYFGLVAYAPLHSDDFLQTMSAGKPILITKLCIYLFSLFIIFPGIPVYCITTRYNLFVGQICRKWPAFFFGIIFPWLVGFLFLQGDFFAMLLNWSSLILTSIVNFVFPFLLYLKCRFEFEAQFSRSKFMSNLDATIASHYFNAVPHFFGKRKLVVYAFIVFLFILTVAIVIFGIAFNIYSLAFLHKNLLS